MGQFITVARYNELTTHWENEDYGDPDSFAYRDSLTPEKRQLVERWDERFIRKEP